MTSGSSPPLTQMRHVRLINIVERLKRWSLLAPLFFQPFRFELTVFMNINTGK
jgi:hypothetical protein